MNRESASYFHYLCRRSRLGYAYRRAWLYPILNLNLHGKAIDIGCGIGDMLRARPRTVGVDINPEAVQYCRMQGLDAHLMDEDSLPFPDQTFDSAILDNVLEHISAPSALLGEIRRVLKKKGILLVGVPGERGYAVDPDHKVFYDQERLVHLLSDNGFACLRLFHLPLPLPIFDRYLRISCLYGIFRRKEPAVPVAEEIHAGNPLRD